MTVMLSPAPARRADNYITSRSFEQRGQNSFLLFFITGLSCPCSSHLRRSFGQRGPRIYLFRCRFFEANHLASLWAGHSRSSIRCHSVRWLHAQYIWRGSPWRTKWTLNQSSFCNFVSPPWRFLSLILYFVLFFYYGLCCLQKKFMLFLIVMLLFVTQHTQPETTVTGRCRLTEDVFRWHRLVLSCHVTCWLISGWSTFNVQRDNVQRQPLFTSSCIYVLFSASTRLHFFLFLPLFFQPFQILSVFFL